MTLRLGYYRKAALGRIFRLAGNGGYGKTTGLLRKRANAILWSYWARPVPA